MLSYGESLAPSRSQAQAGQAGPLGVPERRLALALGFSTASGAARCWAICRPVGVLLKPINL